MTQIQEIPIATTHDSPFHHRRPWGDMEAFAADIELRGVLQPVHARPRPGHESEFELVFGHRRKRGAAAAGLETIPAIVQDYTDAQVRELILVENDQREDVHPIDQAELIRAMLDQDGLAVEDVMAKLGKSRTWVYGRLKFAELAKPVRKAFLEGEIDASKAELVARVPAHLQEQALKLSRGDKWRKEPLSVRELREVIERDLMRSLKGAPFDAGDAELVPKAGACSACPKRTGAQRERFGDIRNPDVCTDPPCFQQKIEAAAERTIETARAEGKTILGQKEAAKIFPHRGDEPGYKAPYVSLDEGCSTDPKYRTWRKLLGKDADVVYARAPSGRLVELVEKKHAQEVLKARGHTFRVTPDGRHASGQETKQRREQAIRKAAVDQVLPLVVKAAEEDSFGLDFQRLVAQALAARTFHDMAKRICERRGIEAKKNSYSGRDFGGALEKAAEEADAATLRGLLAELVAGDVLTGFWSKERYGKRFRAACALFHVDLDAIDAAVRKEKTAKARAKKKAPAKAKVAAPAAKKKAPKRAKAPKAKRTKKAKGA